MLAITSVQLVGPDHAMPEAASYREPRGGRVWLGGRLQRDALTNVDNGFHSPACTETDIASGCDYHRPSNTGFESVLGSSLSVEATCHVACCGARCHDRVLRPIRAQSALGLQPLRRFTLGRRAPAVPPLVPQPLARGVTSFSAAMPSWAGSTVVTDAWNERGSGR
jgi:hypothetical protein